MSRRDTMVTETWRVAVHYKGRCTHGSNFDAEYKARNYYAALVLPGSKTLQVRRAGKSRYETVESRESTADEIQADVLGDRHCYVRTGPEGNECANGCAPDDARCDLNAGRAVLAQKSDGK